MSAFLGSRHGHLFKGAALLNPCLNFPFMLNITDIPDWVSSAVFNRHHSWNFSEEDYKKMFNVSATSTLMNCPTLLIIGAVDQSVPYHAGFAFSA